MNIGNPSGIWNVAIFASKVPVGHNVSYTVVRGGEGCSAVRLRPRSVRVARIHVLVTRDSSIYELFNINVRHERPFLEYCYARR